MNRTLKIILTVLAVVVAAGIAGGAIMAGVIEGPQLPALPRGLGEDV